MATRRAGPTRDLFTVNRRDARQIGALIDEAAGTKDAVTATITSPPYFNLLNYGTARQIGFGQSYTGYLADCKHIFAQIFDRTQPAGSLWLIADTILDQSVEPSRLRNVPFDLAAQCAEAGWILRDVIIWHKDKARPWSQAGRLRNAFEYILYFVKSSDFKYHLDRVREPEELGEWWVKYPERYNPRGKAPENVWNFAIPTQGSWANTEVRHACPLPPNLIERIILLSTDERDLVCDPFAGSGTVVAEAMRLGRRAIGSETNPAYVNAFNRIVKNEIMLRPRPSSITTKQEISRRLELTIHKLRSVKLAKSVWHTYRKRRTADMPLPTHVLSEVLTTELERKAHHQQDVALTFVLDAAIEIREATQRALKEVAMTPPLTKYGISGDVRVVSSQEALDLFDRSSLWLYLHGETWHHVGAVDASSFLRLPISNRRMGYPPIAATVAVAVSPEDRPGSL